MSDSITVERPAYPEGYRLNKRDEWRLSIIRNAWDLAAIGGHEVTEGRYDEAQALYRRLRMFAKADWRWGVEEDNDPCNFRDGLPTARHARRGEQIAARGRRIESELREFTGAAVSLKWYGEWVSLVDEDGRKVIQIVD